MSEPFFDSAADRIAFSEAVDYIEQGRPQLIQPQLVQAYERKGLLRRAGDKLELTEEGQRQNQIARRERFTDG